jgi:DNA-binding CsgD family transcriptional regulator
MMRRSSRAAERATDREVGVVAAVLAAGSEKAAAHQLGLSHSTVKHHLASARCKVGVATTAQLVWILAPRLPEPEGMSKEIIRGRRPGVEEAVFQASRVEADWYCRDLLAVGCRSCTASHPPARRKASDGRLPSCSST